MNEATWIQKFTEMGAFWMHDGNPERPHALLTSGGHSNGFFNGSVVIRRPPLLVEACKGLIQKAKLNRVSIGMVVGSAHGATTIAYEIARQLDAPDAGFTEPVVVDGEKQMAFKRFPIDRWNSGVLLVEDVMSTGGTTRKTADAVKKAGGVVFYKVLVLVNRSGMQNLGNRTIVALIDREMPTWAPDECPLCEEGSEAIRPKDADNWNRLTVHY